MQFIVHWKNIHHKYFLFYLFASWSLLYGLVAIRPLIFRRNRQVLVRVQEQTPSNYGEMSNSQKRFSMFCIIRLHFLNIEKYYTTVRVGTLKTVLVKGAGIGAVLGFYTF